MSQKEDAIAKRALALLTMVGTTVLLYLTKLLWDAFLAEASLGVIVVLVLLVVEMYLFATSDDVCYD
jgi:hypothetical protein